MSNITDFQGCTDEAAFTDTEESADFYREIGYTFRDPALLRRAFTHSSYTNEFQMPYHENNERLEFLGDAVLDAVISAELYSRLGQAEEGFLTKTRALIVCERSLMECAVRLDVGRRIRLGKGEMLSGGRRRISILADAMEALIGAVFLDGGWETAQKMVLALFQTTIEDALAGKLNSDYKTELQEKLQADGIDDIHYVVVREEGPDHAKIFYIELRAAGRALGQGHGRTKKEAEQIAARNALEMMR